MTLYLTRLKLKKVLIFDLLWTKDSNFMLKKQIAFTISNTLSVIPAFKYKNKAAKQS